MIGTIGDIQFTDEDFHVYLMQEQIFKRRRVVEAREGLPEKLCGGGCVWPISQTLPYL